MTAETAGIWAAAACFVAVTFVQAMVARSLGLRLQEALAEITRLTACVIAFKTPSAAGALGEALKGSRRGTTASVDEEEEELIA